MQTEFHDYTIRSFKCDGGYRVTIDRCSNSESGVRYCTGVLGVYETEEKAIEAGRDCILIREMNKAA